MIRQRADRGLRRKATCGFALLAGAVLLSSCVSGKDDTSGSADAPAGGSGAETEDSSPLASSVTTSTKLADNLNVDVLSLDRHNEDVVVLSMRATNNAESEIRLSDLFMYPPRAGGQRYTPNGVSLIDTKNMKRHRPLVEKGQEGCLCSDWQGDIDLQSGDSIDFWVAFPSPPEDVTDMVVSTTITPDFPNIPLKTADSADEEITGSPIEEPRILALSSLQDDLDGSSSREESGDETSIMLSSDVLFELNESEVTSEAANALESVASEIDNASGKTVRIDGYTDNSGNDSINVPLSEDRALAVETELEDLVTRSGITFETAGHGSNDPVATNDTEEGRQKNRRVTISFEK
ncbi:OmpA family protein [Nocardiopsis halophila]|uniref:OmpA family protein n=1 Tax=Nocardiopsis halophila TaxID=141692 RepID=UPI001F4CAC83|nr:OmpA family protein [Nocardiopsis halophila]